MFKQVVSVTVKLVRFLSCHTIRIRSILPDATRHPRSGVYLAGHADVTFGDVESAEVPLSEGSWRKDYVCMYGWMEDSIPMTASPKTMDLNTFTSENNWMVSALRAQDCKIG